MIFCNYEKEGPVGVGELTSVTVLETVRLGLWHWSGTGEGHGTGKGRKNNVGDPPCKVQIETTVLVSVKGLFLLESSRSDHVRLRDRTGRDSEPTRKTDTRSPKNRHLPRLEHVES